MNHHGHRVDDLGRFVFFRGVAAKKRPTLTIVVARVELAVVILYGDMMVMDVRMLAGWSVSSAFVDTALLNKAISFSLIVWDRAEIGSGLTAILNATTFMFTVFISRISASDEKTSLLKILVFCRTRRSCGDNRY